MKVAVMPGFSELRIAVSPAGEASRGEMLDIVMPWLYAPWPEAQSKGIAEISEEGDTLRALLTELSAQYKRANVDFEPINPRTNELDADYDASVNEKNYIALPRGLDVKLADGDEVNIKILWRWDG